MKRACPIAAAALVICLSSIAQPAEGVLFGVPLPVTAQLCRDDTRACEVEQLPAGADLQTFMNRHADAGTLYHLVLQLPAGEFELDETWLIDGRAIPRHITSVSVIGSHPGTWLSGSRTLAALRANTTEQLDGSLLIELPVTLRTRLMSLRKYDAADSAWPMLKDRLGELRMTQWPADGWSSFDQREASADGAWVPVAGDAPLGAWRDESSAWVQGFFRHGWHADYEPLAETRTDSSAIRLGGQPQYGIGGSGRFRMLNLCTAVRRPGEYCIDARRGRLHVFPRDASTRETLRISLLEEPLLRLRGTRNITIKSLGFKDTRGDAVVVEDSTDVRMTQLAFEHIGRSGLFVDGGRDVRVSASSFADTGSHAIVLRGGDRITLTASGHRIENCRIQRPTQRLDTPGTGIRLEGVGHVVRGNVIEDAPHSAIYFDGNDHLIEMNWIERVCLEVDDAGAIYAGRDWTYRGNVIRRNVIASLPNRRGTANLNAIYLDDMLSGTTVYANLLFDAPRGVLVGGGRDNLLEDNLFVRTQTAIHIDQRALEWAGSSARPGGVLFDRLTRVPYRGVTWRHAYPGLADILAQRPAYPLNNVVRGNASLGAGGSIIAPAADGRQIEKFAALDSTIADRGSVREFIASCGLEPGCAARIAGMGLPAP